MVRPFQNQFPIILQATAGCAPTKELCQNPILYLRHVFDVYNFVLREGKRQFFHHPTSNLLKLTKPSWIDKNYACATRSNLPAISFPEAAILLVSDGDWDLWPDWILSPQIADFLLHCAESKVKPKMADGGEKWSRYISGRREIWIRKSWKSKYYPQTETKRDPENNRFDAKRCFSRSPNWLRKIEEGLAFSALENLTEFQLIFAHPEALVGNKNVIKLLKTAELKNRMKAIVVDEAHLVVDW